MASRGKKKGKPQNGQAKHLVREESQRIIQGMQQRDEILSEVGGFLAKGFLLQFPPLFRHLDRLRINLCLIEKKRK